ncbi:uncharacterized protein BO96DRAFT_53738 [Aspergillus niger CBS 101883]|uniref:uncharacterized protein n=1 Tax=Aspergillus lacticoffeatus (strain CBS 101883) TaxID=1450533 RepID=UPI000D7EF834|nr:uncharacterized protein BO96DRAFT_53738 [Aspergillus niger CBS 101883]PYH56233.1 hypothetical protein BO96DRAFT_53738 [Aspergillus niger CBS 101883]
MCQLTLPTNGYATHVPAASGSDPPPRHYHYHHHLSTSLSSPYYPPSITTATHLLSILYTQYHSSLTID